jgi:hypothetical protein
MITVLTRAGRWWRGVVLAVLALAGLPAAAQPDARLLITLPGQDAPVVMAMEALLQLPLTGYRTSTVWTEGVDDYSGVLLLTLLTHLGVDPGQPGGRVRVQALDGYAATLDFDQITAEAPLLALLRNGAPMPIRGQGPFWLIFPYDSSSQYRTESVYALSVWQITTLRIEVAAR